MKYYFTVISLSTSALISGSVVDEETIKRKLEGKPLIEILPRTIDEIENADSIIALQFPKIKQHTTDLNLVLLDEIQFTSLRCTPDSCSGDTCNCMAGFCKTNSAEDINARPENFPTYNYVSDTEYCHFQEKSFQINDIFNEIQNYDTQNNIVKNKVEFIVSDMGGTKAPERLAVPLKVALPNKKIVAYAQPLTDAMMMCDSIKNTLTRKRSCNAEAVKNLVEKVIYLLCRDAGSDGCVLLLSPDVNESLSYLDIKKLGDNIPVAAVYGPPEVGISNYPIPIERSYCNRYKVNRPTKIKQMARASGLDERNISPEENCALYMAVSMQEQNIWLEHKEGYNINTLDLPYALEPLVRDVFGTALSEEKKKIMEEKASKDMFGVLFPKYLENKADKMDARMKTAAKLLHVDEKYEILEVEDDGTGRKLEQKRRMTDWPLSN